MTTIHALIGLGLLALVPQQQQEVLQPVQPQAPRAQSFEQVFQASEWRERLSQRDLNAREQSYAELLELARKDARIADEVRAWSRGQDELAWSARLLLRELDRRGARGALRTFRTDGWGDMQERMHERMQERMQDLQQRMERLREEVERDFGRAFEREGPMTRQQRQVETRQDPNGARVEVRTRTGNGPEEVKVYEGRTLDEIYQAHPELEAENALKDQLAPPSRMPMVPDRRVLQPMQQRSVLGVMCQPKDGGLQIEEVVDGSIAAQVGLRAGDVLLELNGTPVPSREEVARVLQDRRPGEDLVIVIQDANGKRRTLTHRSNY
jgi:hypothetical protein